MRHSRGFTLLEILVAVAILGVALVSLLALHARNLRLFAESQDITVAGLLASRLAAETQAGAFPVVGTDNGTFVGLDDDPSVDFGERTGGNLATRFSWRRDVESTGLQNLRRVRVSVFAGSTDEQDVAPVVAFDFVVRRGGPP